MLRPAKRADAAAAVAARHGGTLAELLVAMLLAVVVLGTATRSLLRQQRTSEYVERLALTDAQARSAVAILGAEVAQLEAGQGDLAAGEASDSAFQLRSLIALSVACVGGNGTATLAPSAAAPSGAVPVSAPRAGDSLWWQSDSTWRGQRVEDASLGSVSCAAPLSGSGKAWRLVLHGSDTIPAGSVLRLTRGARYGFYRSGDGTWQLGYREWSDGTHRFAAPQPVAGPFVMRAGARRTGVRYFDSADVELPLVNGFVDVGRVARMRFITLTVVQARSAAADTIRADSADVALARPS